MEEFAWNQNNFDKVEVPGSDNTRIFITQHISGSTRTRRG